jgi:helix-turn-helix protein
VYEIGKTLRDERMRRRLDVAECERATKIRSKYLRALEEEEFGMLPDPAYVKGFIRAYADHLDLDAQLLLDEYATRFEVEPESGHENKHANARRPPGSARRDSRAASRRPARRRSRFRLPFIIVGIVVVAVAAVAVYLAFRDDGGSASTTASAPSIRLALTGVGAGAVVEVRRRSAGGSLVWRGRVAGGESRRFAARRPLWVRLAPARNVRVVLSGRPASPTGGSTAYLATDRGLVPASAA